MVHRTSPIVFARIVLLFLPFFSIFFTPFPYSETLKIVQSCSVLLPIANVCPQIFADCGDTSGDGKMSLWMSLHSFSVMVQYGL